MRGDSEHILHLPVPASKSRAPLPESPRPDQLFAVRPLTPYRSLPAEKRLALVTHTIKSSREGRALYVQRMAARGGFRPTTLQQWPAEKLAAEVVRMKAETSDDELNLLHLLYVELEPAIRS